MEGGCAQTKYKKGLMNRENGRCGLEVRGSDRILLVRAPEWCLFLVKIDFLYLLKMPSAYEKASCGQ